MSAHKLSPNFEDRFAQIDIGIPKLGDPPILKQEYSSSSKSPSNSPNKLSSTKSLVPPTRKSEEAILACSSSPRSKKKVYPSSLYPSGLPSGSHNNSNRTTTPSRLPLLSTARRAESRTASANHTYQGNNDHPSKDRQRGLSSASRLPSSKSISTPSQRLASSTSNTNVNSRLASSASNSRLRSSSSNNNMNSSLGFVQNVSESPHELKQLDQAYSNTPSTPSQLKPSKSISQLSAQTPSQSLLHKTSSKSLPASKQPRSIKRPQNLPQQRATTSHSLGVPSSNTSASSSSTPGSTTNPYPFSFMRETSSSKKKHTTPFQSPNPTPTYPSSSSSSIPVLEGSSVRSRSVSEINHKRSSLNAHKKRQLSTYNKTTPTYTSSKSKPSYYDCTPISASVSSPMALKPLEAITLDYNASNFSQLAVESKLQKISNLNRDNESDSDTSVSPTRVVENAADDILKINKRKEHPYAKLANNIRQQQQHEAQISPQNSATRPRIGSISKTTMNSENKIHPRRVSIQKDASNIGYSPTKLSYQHMHPHQQPQSQSETPPLPGSKIGSIRQLCNIIYQQDPTVFEYKQPSEEFQYTANNSYAPQDIIAKADFYLGEGSLSIYERGEILRKKDLYYIPTTHNACGGLDNSGTTKTNGNAAAMSTAASRTIDIRSYSDNYGFDDKHGNYVVIPNDHINYRYEIERVLGNGSFGNVVLCRDHKYSSQEGRKNKVVALKIIKNDLNWSLQAVYEIKMLKHLNENFKVGGPGINISNFDPEYLREYGNNSGECPVLTYYDHFHFRGHMCIITEVLSLNLYSLLEITKFRGFSINLLKMFSIKILQGLQFIHHNKIIHCDIKPENIMIKFPDNFDPNGTDEIGFDDFIVKIIDFGSSCFNNEISYSYIQSRFYRAPEVITGAKYDNMIDVWSFGCVIAELYSGYPLFPGKNELEQVGLIAEVFGAPSSALITSQRNRLIKSIRTQNSAKNILDGMSDKISMTMNKTGAVDEKSIKRTLLYTLFDAEGKFNLQFLNYRLQAISQSQSANTNTKQGHFNPPPRRTFRLNSKNLEIMLKLSSNHEDKANSQSFVKFLNAIFKWDPNERMSAASLLNHRFLNV